MSRNETDKAAALAETKSAEPDISDDECVWGVTSGRFFSTQDSHSGWPIIFRVVGYRPRVI